MYIIKQHCIDRNIPDLRPNKNKTNCFHSPIKTKFSKPSTRITNPFIPRHHKTHKNPPRTCTNNFSPPTYIQRAHWTLRGSHTRHIRVSILTIRIPGIVLSYTTATNNMVLALRRIEWGARQTLRHVSRTLCVFRLSHVLHDQNYCAETSTRPRLIYRAV